MKLTFVLIIFSSISFIYYGINSFYSKKMILEYSRWGYDKLRFSIALCQLLGGCGLLAGLLHSSLYTLIPTISFLLSIMMINAVFTRIRVKDKLIDTIPSVFYFILNAVIFLQSISFQALTN